MNDNLKAITNNTRFRIYDAFITIYREKPLRSIRVSEIAKIAKINRSTFYEYFKDPYDVLDQLEDFLLDYHISKTRIKPGSNNDRKYTVEELTYDIEQNSGEKITLVMQMDDSKIARKLSLIIENYIKRVYNLDYDNPAVKCQTVGLASYIVSYIRAKSYIYPVSESTKEQREILDVLFEGINEGINQMVKISKKKVDP